MKKIKFLGLVSLATPLVFIASCSKNDKEYEEFKIQILSRIKNEFENSNSLIEKTNNAKTIADLEKINIELNSLKNNNKKEQKNELDEWMKTINVPFLKIVNPGELYRAASQGDQLIYDYKHKTVVTWKADENIKWSEVDHLNKTVFERNEFNNEYQALNSESPTFKKDNKVKTNSKLSYELNDGKLKLFFKLYKYNAKSSIVSDLTYTLEFEVNENSEVTPYEKAKTYKKLDKYGNEITTKTYENALVLASGMTVEKLIPILTSNPNGIKYIDEISSFGTLKGSNDESNKLFWLKKNIRTKDILNNPTIDNKNSLNYIDAVYEESTKILTFKYTIKDFPLKLFTQKINLENNSFNSSTVVTEFKETDKVKQTTETNDNSEENPKKTDEISVSDENKALRILTSENDGFSVWDTGAMFSIEFKNDILDNNAYILNLVKEGSEPKIIVQANTSINSSNAKIIDLSINEGLEPNTKYLIEIFKDNKKIIFENSEQNSITTTNE